MHMPANMFIHMCTQIITHMSIIYTHVYTHACTHVYTHVYTTDYTHVYNLHACLYACLYTCLYTCLHTCLCEVLKHMCTVQSIRAPGKRCVNEHMHRHVHKHAYKHAYRHAFRRAYRLAHGHVYTHAHRHPYTCIRHVLLSRQLSCGPIDIRHICPSTKSKIFKNTIFHFLVHHNMGTARCIPAPHTSTQPCAYVCP